MAKNESAGAKGLIRSLVKRGSQDLRKRGRAEEEARGPARDGSVCDRCGAIYGRRTWRRAARRFPARPIWTVCPSCSEAKRKEWHGRVLVRGVDDPAERRIIERRIDNVAARASFTRPGRRIVSVEWSESDLEVLTTSQAVAHRIVRELLKLRGGKARYQWDANDGSLFAVWEPPAKARR